MKFTAKELAEVLHGTVDGDPQATATTFAKIEHGKPGELCFYANPKYEQYVYTSKASILLVNKDFEPKEAVTPTLVRVENAYSALADLLEYVKSLHKSYRRHRGRCSIAWSAKIGKKVWVGDFVTIGKKSQIGDCTKIYNNVTIGENVKIGEKCIIYFLGHRSRRPHYPPCRLRYWRRRFRQRPAARRQLEKDRACR